MCFPLELCLPQVRALGRGWPGVSFFSGLRTLACLSGGVVSRPFWKPLASMLPDLASPHPHPGGALTLVSVQFSTVPRG